MKRPASGFQATSRTPTETLTASTAAPSTAGPASAPQRIEITGSAIKRIQSEGALPVQLISREEIARSGVVNTEQLLQSLSSIPAQGGIGTTTGAGTSTYGRATVSVRRTAACKRFATS